MQALRFLLFFAITGTFAGLIHWYLYRRLVRDVTGSPGWRRRGKLLFIALFAFLFSGPPVGALGGSAGQLYSAVAWSWMGVAVLLTSLLVGVDLARAVSWPFRRKQGAAGAAVLATPAGSGALASAEAPASPERRLFLSRVAAGGAVAASGGLSGYGLWRAYTPPEVTELSLVLPRLPKTLDGLTLVQVSDIHVGPLIQRRFMDDMVRRCNALKPDLVAVTGDLVDGSVEELGGHVAALRDLRSRFGTFFVTGNHEYYSGEEEWTEALTRMGLTVLRDRHVTIGDAGGALDLVGVEDWTSGGREHRLEQAMAGRDPDRPAVLLAHQPRELERAVARGIGLQLSGHTHGGQFFPGTLLIPLIWPQPAGHFTHQDGHLYVSRGTGFWGPPMRVGAPPEIVKLVLRAA